MTAVVRRLGLALFLAAAMVAGAQTGTKAPQPATPGPAAPSTHTVQDAAQPGAAITLYRKLRAVGLDPSAVYSVRDAGFDREDLHITLDDGTIAFLQSVDGRVTGAFFEGEGEVLLVPPNLAERGSLALFTGAAVLEEKFTTAYFRFNDNTAAGLQPALRPAEEPAAFIAKWGETAAMLAESDALRLIVSFLNQAPQPGGDRFLRARLSGAQLGIFDVYYDTLSAEQIAVLKFSTAEGRLYYDVLASFPSRSARRSGSEPRERSMVEGAGSLDRLHIGAYKVKARVQPPNTLQVRAELDVDVRQGGDRILFFELSRYLKLKDFEADGKPMEFLQNEAIEGSALARRGNDVVAVVFPEPLRAGQRMKLEFDYAGNVLSDAGGGLFYVGARGIWYPNRGMHMADYDLEFRYPSEWTLVATGKRVSQQTEGAETIARYVSERPMPLAGFNLGRYTVESTKAGTVLVEAYASAGVEHTFPQPRALVAAPPPPVARNPRAPVTPEPLPLPPPKPDPAQEAQNVAQTSARAIDFFSQHFGPYPYSSLALSQIPGSSSQGWPGLVFLSSFAFLTPEQRAQMRMGPFNAILYDQFMQVHETAHQWWGDLITWGSYRDQWIVEALANYSAVLVLEKDRPEQVNAVLHYYREHLLSTNAAGEELGRAGAVTLGVRLSNSHFPDGFEAVSYGRGTWLFHMLRHMLNDTAPASRAPGDEPFLRALRKLRDRYQGKAITTRELQSVMEEEMPDALKYEGRKSLDWFFNTWVNGTAIPKLELRDVKIVNRSSGAVATGRILQKEASEELITSVPIYAATARGQVLAGRIFADGSDTTFRLTVPAGARKLLLDPYHTVLARQ